MPHRPRRPAVGGRVTHRAGLLVCAAVVMAATGGCRAREPASLVIAGGMIVDGEGGPPRAGTVVISGNAIVSVGEGGRAALDTIDATGLVVAPGFIDVHSHTPPAIAQQPMRLNEGVVRQGVTTVFGGPDGGFAPAQILALMEAYHYQGTGTNVAFYVGHNGIRREVMGDDQRRPPTEDELERMRALVREGMEMGAFGLSTGLMYEPGMFADTEEVIALALEAAAYGGVYDSHVRNPVHAFVESDREVVRIAQIARLPGKIGHLKAVGLHNEGVIEEIIELVEAARAQGTRIVSDQYPYDGAAIATLARIIVVPPGLEGFDALRRMQRRGRTDEGMAELRAALADPGARARLKEASENGIDGGFAWLKATGYTSMRITSSADYPELVGAYLSEIAEERGQDPFDAVADLIIGSSRAGQPDAGRDQGTRCTAPHGPALEHDRQRRRLRRRLGRAHRTPARHRHLPPPAGTLRAGGGRPHPGRSRAQDHLAAGRLPRHHRSRPPRARHARGHRRLRPGDDHRPVGLGPSPALRRGGDPRPRQRRGRAARRRNDG